MEIETAGQKILADVARGRAVLGDRRELDVLHAVGTLMAAGVDPATVVAVGERTIRTRKRDVPATRAMIAAVWLLAEIALEEDARNGSVHAP